MRNALSALHVIHGRTAEFEVQCIGRASCETIGFNECCPTVSVCRAVVSDARLLVLSAATTRSHGSDGFSTMAM